jgi:hypothetical protein
MIRNLCSRLFADDKQVVSLERSNGEREDELNIHFAELLERRESKSA